jgi:uncharacterized protein YndB with AHSA1/START domain
MKSSKSAGRVGGDYRREITVHAPVERLFDAVATPDGVRGWWTRLVSGSSDRGGALRLDFEGMDEHIDLRVVRSRRPTEVEWRVIEHTSLEEWQARGSASRCQPATLRARSLSSTWACRRSSSATISARPAGVTSSPASSLSQRRGQGMPFRAARV